MDLQGKSEQGPGHVRGQANERNRKGPQQGSPHKLEIDAKSRASTSKTKEVKFKVDHQPVPVIMDPNILFHYQQLFPHLFFGLPVIPVSVTPPTPPLPYQSLPGFQFSKNCQNFNRLFHSSFDEDESSSTNQELDPPKNCDTKEDLTLDESPKEEILLEIEIETEEPPIDYSMNTAITTNLQLKANDPVKFIDCMESSIINTHKLEDFLEDSDLDERSQSQSTPKKSKLQEVSKQTESLSETVGRTGQRKSNRLVQQSTSCKTQEAQIMRRITFILKKDVETLTDEDKSLLEAFPTLVRIVRKRFEARVLSTERLKEFEDSPEVLELKCNQLAEIISSAKYLVVYSGAGISTSANIPDFRGTTGLWTLFKSGQSLDTQNVDTQVLTSADPTTTHMALKQLYADGIVKHIVSQNCDGLHLRSGIPKMGLSEIHGNMYIEVCGTCGRDYVRTFDVAENTRRHEHRTGRRCYNCHNSLRDTIVHFGERGKLRWPINWAGAEYNAHRADVILCIGSSLKVLRRYPWLWCMDKPATKRPKLVIVNLMWTPKDQFAALKIHGRCDDVMTQVMQKLNMTIPSYSRLADPLFRIATPLHLTEIRTRSSRELAFPENEPLPLKLVDMNNYVQFEPVFRLRSNHNTSDEDAPDDDLSPSEKDKCKTKSNTAKKSAKKVPAKKKEKNRVIKKGNGNGWLGNLTPGVKMKKRKVK